MSLGLGLTAHPFIVYNSLAFPKQSHHLQTHELNNGAGSHYETESPAAAEAPLASKRPLEEAEGEEAGEQKEAKRVREDDDGEQQQQQGGEEEEEVEHHGEQQQQQQVVPSPQLPIHTGGD